MFTTLNKLLCVKGLIVLFAFSFQTYAQNFQDEFTGPEITLGPLSTTTSSALSGTTDVSPYTYISLGIQNNAAPYTAYEFSLTLQVTPILSDGTPATSSYTISLEVENNLSAGSGDVVDKQQHVIENTYGANVEVLGNIFEDVQAGSGPQPNAQVPNNIVLTVGFNTTRYYELSQAAPTNVTSTQLNNELTVSWDAVTEARYYDVEWTWIDNYGEDISTPLTAAEILFSTLDFEHNSTRIQTDQTSYSIPLVYSRGYVIYRVRAVGNFLADLSKNKYSSWSNNPTVPDSKVSDWGASDAGFHLINQDHEANKNWQFQASYAEEGKKKEVVSYFDGSLRNRQTVTTINTDKNAVVGEVIYDAQGRPAVEVLPVPIPDDEIKYHDNFNLNNDPTPQPYSYKDFDVDAQNVVDQMSNDKLMNTNSGASNYYSEANTSTASFKDRIPNANQYPFSQIEYTPDNTGRIRRKSGVGSTHQLGSGHEMEYYYGVPEQIELNRLFGYAVGNATHYKKNMVLDPNRQLSVSYIDPQGRTIATTLAGDAPISGNLLGLEDEGNNSLHDVLTIDLLNKVSSTDTDTSMDNNEIGVSGTFGALQDQLSYYAIKTAVFDDMRSFTYSVTNTPFIYGCTNDIYPLDYNLTINVLDGDAQSLFPINQQTQLPEYVSMPVSLNGSNTVTLSSGELPPLTVQRGTFTITKNLVVYRTVAEMYADAYIAKLQDPGDDCYVDPTVISPAPLIIDGCFSSCEECEESITNVYPTIASYISAQRATYTQEELDLLPDLDNELTAQYNEAIKACNAPCNDADVSNSNGENPNIVSCQTALAQLLNDMSPIGQYGNGPDNTESSLNIFNTNNVLFSTKTGQTGLHNSWKNPNHPDYDPIDPGTALYTQGHYYNEDDSISYIKVKQIITVNEDGEEIITYQPDIDASAASTLIPTEDVAVSNEYLVEPQYLANSDNLTHPDVWQDSWAYSLLTYHPEYDYLLYSEKVCELIHSSGLGNFTSDGFDAYLQSVTTFEEADNPSLLGSFTSLMDEDPYFLSMIGSGSDGFDTSALLAARQSIMNQALTVDFDGTGSKMMASTHATIVCNSLGGYVSFPKNRTV